MSTDLADENADGCAELVPAAMAVAKAPAGKILKSSCSADRPFLFSENCYGSAFGVRRTNHLTVECLVSVRAQLLLWDDALAGWLPFDNGSLCNVALLQQITCQQTLSPSLLQPSKRSSWSGYSQAGAMLPNSARMTPVWEYHLQGNRISDQKNLFTCTLTPHMTYVSALPTFHHWRIDERKFALSFGSAYDAAKFHNRLQKALGHLCRQSKSSSGDSNLDATEELEDDVFAPIELGATPAPAPRGFRLRTRAVPQEAPPTEQAEDDFVKVAAEEVVVEANSPPIEDEASRGFLCVTTTIVQREAIPSDEADPPMDPETARRGTEYCELSDHVSSSSGYDSTWRSGDPASQATDVVSSSAPEPSKPDRPLSDSLEERPPAKVHLVCEPKSAEPAKEKLRSVSNPGTGKFLPRGTYPLNKFGAMIKSKSLLESHMKAVHNPAGTEQKQRSQSFGKSNIPSAKVIQQREKCRYCSKWYNVSENGRSACRDAPDRVNEVLKKVTCYALANNVVQRCSASNGSSSMRPFQSRRLSDVPRPSAWRRRVGFALASLLCPCVCCYVPLKKARRICCCARDSGGRHAPDSKSHEALPTASVGYGATSMRRSSSRNLISRLSF
uniref:WH1 domain-containing protein n=1 Tax=Steinernema glaseri TaxID=37863 RepID=A0A1I7ZSI4_9BILA